MRYDCGSLRANPKQSPTYRYLMTSGERRYYAQDWPKNIQLEAAIFSSTPGVSRRWLLDNLNFTQDIIENLRVRFPNALRLGEENMLTATYDDAVNYCRRSRTGTKLPVWAVPFYLEDVKNRIGEKEIKRIWGSSRGKMRKFDFINRR